jgi:DNA-directed RNA polymerase subunit K/omega
MEEGAEPVSEDRLNVEDFRNTTPNIYRAVVIAAKEARKINNLRRMQTVHDPEYMEPEAKVTTEALTRLIEGRVEYSEIQPQEE